MPSINIKSDGNVTVAIGAVIVGVVVLFVGIFMLASVDPMFEGRLTECSNVDTAPSAAAALNATSGSGSTSANMTFASATNVQGTCTLVLNVSNVSATTGSYLEIRNSTGGALINNHTVPAIAQVFTSSTTIVHASGNYLANVTAFGGDNVTVPTGGSYLRCCSALVARATVAGQHYNRVRSRDCRRFA